MKVDIQIESSSKVILNPKLSKETDNVIRGPADAHKVLKHFKKATGSRFTSRFTVTERSSGNHVYTDITSIESIDKVASDKKLGVLHKYLKRYGWKQVSGHKTSTGASIWEHKLSYLHLFIGPTIISSRGVGFTVEVIGTESDTYLRAMRKRHKHGPRTNKIHEALIKRGENPTVIRIASTGK